VHFIDVKRVMSVMLTSQTHDVTHLWAPKAWEWRRWECGGACRRRSALAELCRLARRSSGYRLVLYMAPPNAYSGNQTDLSIIHCHYWVIFFSFWVLTLYIQYDGAAYNQKTEYKVTNIAFNIRRQNAN